MGCDIHLHVEVKIDGKWEHWSAPNVDRWYWLFANMAGVRNYGEEKITPISEPKGLPQDVAPATMLDCEHMGVDGHSHSWLGKEEIEELQERLKKERGKLTTSSYLEFDLKYGILRTYICGNSLIGAVDNGTVEDVRLVFWFDN